jgi:hypothetical protein
MQRPHGVHRRSRHVQARAAVCWAGVCFAAYQAAFFLLSLPFPQLIDPEFGGKLYHLRTRLREAPDARPLVVALGSSHVGLGLRPEALSRTTSGGSPAPLVFNFALNDSGPVTSLLCLRRLLAEGIRPDWVLVEPCPLMLLLEGPRVQNRCLMELSRMQRCDLNVLSRYYPEGRRIRTEWLQLQMLPWFAHRLSLLNYAFPTWVPQSMRVDCRWQHMDGWGWQWAEGLTDTVYLRRPEVRQMAQGHYTAIYRDYAVGTVSQLALLEIVLTCRHENIGVALLRMPEGTYFQRWYPRALLTQIDGCLREVGERGVPIIDARNWLPDTAFSDGHHLTPDGALAFTREFEQRVLGRLAAATYP